MDSKPINNNNINKINNNYVIQAYKINKIFIMAITIKFLLIQSLIKNMFYKIFKN